MDYVLLALIIFAAILTQSIAGFGVALVAMPMLVTLMQPVAASTLLAITSLPMQVIILWRYRHALQARSLWRLMVSSVIGIPLGVYALATLDQHVILTALGVVLIAYSLCSLVELKLPLLTMPAWAFGFGFFAGILSGAFNTGGPPFVIYGQCRGWKPDQFKANMQLLLMVNAIIVVIAHLAAGHLTDDVLNHYVVTLPTVFVATAVGFRISERINAVLFRRVVLVLLLMIGIRLLIP